MEACHSLFLRSSRELSLEDRVGRIFDSACLELDGEAYVGKYILNDWKSIEGFINKKLRLNDEGKNILYRNLDTGDKIIISGRSAGKIASHLKYGEIYQKTIIHIPEIIKNMKFLEDMSADSKNAKFPKYSYYITGVNIDETPYTIISTVGHNEYGTYYYHNVFDGIKQDVFKRAELAGAKDTTYGRLANIIKRRSEP